MAEAFLKELLFKNIDLPTFITRLDLKLDDGGAGWNKLRAQSFTQRTASILDTVQKIKEQALNGPLVLSEYLINHFHLKLSENQKLRLQALLKLRLESQIGQIEVQKRLDMTVATGGIGLHKTTAEKVVRETEIIMLLKYS